LRIIAETLFSPRQNVQNQSKKPIHNRHQPLSAQKTRMVDVLDSTFSLPSQT
jgi:hypothetical protein